MRRNILVAGAAGVVAASALAIWQAGPTTAEQPANVNGPTRAAAPTLPIAQVVLFSTGVGYFQREGEVQGNARVDLTFPVQDINDLIKSMVLSDLGGGHVSAVSYESQAPIEKTLRSFAINLTNNPTFGQILNQARGEKVEAVLQQGTTTQPGTMTGVIMGVEKKKETRRQGVVESEFVNLWCAEGMRSVKLGDVQRVRFLNPVMDSEVKKALEVLSLSHDTQKKAVSLAFSGEGKRDVRVGYVVENPIWKTSYRLVLDRQGQAVPAGLGRGREHAGRRLEQRPHVAGIGPADQLPDGPVPAAVRAAAGGRAGAVRVAAAADLHRRHGSEAGRLQLAGKPNRGNSARIRTRPTPRLQLDHVHGTRTRPADLCRVAAALPAASQHGQARRWERMDLAKGVQLGGRRRPNWATSIQYKIENPVSLARQKSALLPIVNQEVEGTKVSIYNESVQAKFPLLGLKFKNSTPLHLMQGPITVFDNNSYAGDARILDLQPKEERLDLLRHRPGHRSRADRATAESDQITRSRSTRASSRRPSRVREEKTYKIKNRSEHDRSRADRASLSAGVQADRDRGARASGLATSIASRSLSRPAKRSPSP